MSAITFNMRDLKPLAEELEKASEFAPTMDLLFDPKNHVNGVILDAKGRTEEEAEAADVFFWPSDKNMRKDVIGPCLQLVGDQGLYLITNARFEDESSPASRGTVAYAKGCDPNKDDDFYENKVALFGGDDGTVAIPYRWYLMAKNKGKRVFKLNLTEDSVSVVL